MLDNMDLTQYNNQQLKACLHELKGKTSGNKQELVLRLQAYDADVVKSILDQQGARKDHETSVNVLDTSTVSSGEETVANLKGEVAILKDTVQQLVLQLQNFLSAPKPGMTVQTDSSNDTPGAAPVPVVLPNEGINQAATPVAVDRPVNITTLEGVEHEAPGVQVGAGPVNEVPAVIYPIASPGARAQAGNPILNYSPVPVFEVDQRTYGMHGGVLDQSRHDTGLRVASHADVRDVTRIMPDFCPGSGLSSTMFIDRINQLSRAYGWSDQMLLYAIYDKLKGPARQWINSMPIFQRWSDFVTAFLADFPCEVNTADLNIRMMRSRMNKGESYVDYFYKMLALGRGGNMLDSAIITYIINGLYDDTTKRILSAMHFPRCADLLRTLTNLSTEKRPGMPHGSTQALNTQVQRQNNTLPGTSRSHQGSNDKVVCFRCRESGHIAKHCTKYKKPSGGERVNTVVVSEVQQPAPINSIAQKQNRQELLHNIVILCTPTVSCKALMDSGSARSLIKRSVANKCTSQRTECKETLVGFAGGELCCTERIDVDVQLDEAVYPAELVIVDDGAMKYDVVIGIDVLAQGTVVIEKGVCRNMPVNVADVDVERELPEDVMNKFKHTLNKFAHCFGEKLDELGRSKNFQMNIKLTTTKPVIRKPYPIPIPKQMIVEDIINQLLDLGIVQHSQSAYSSPIVLVKKQNGENRLCVDYREVNAITEKQPWQMPTVDGVLATLANQKFFTTLDMMSGYYQIELDETSRQFTAFVTHQGHYEFRRMPFGLRNAPSAFQRMMAGLIAPLGKHVISYVDEIIIATQTAESNIDVLIKFLQLVEREGLTLRISKCSFLKHSVTFLGHEIDKHGIKPGARKTIAIDNYPTPTNQLDIRRFLGLAGFFRKFVPSFAIIAKPLTALLKKDVVFKWSVECVEAFQKLKQILTNSPVLTMYDVDKEHELHTDASCIGLAAILLQRENDLLKPLAYFSRACNNAETKYHAYELEVLAVVEACERFRLYLLGKQFTIVTDCQAIASAKITRPMVPRVARWFLKLMEYDYKIVHRPGEQMSHVDALSRGIETTDDEYKTSTAVMEVTVNDWVTTLQRQDDKIKIMLDVLTGKTPSDQRKHLSSEYCVQQHRLFKKTADNKLLLAVPRGMRWRIAKLCHDDAGHPGVDGTIKRVLLNFWFPRLRNFIKGYVKSCIDCAYHREPVKKEGELFGMEIPRLPFQVLHMDHLGPFVKSRRGNEYILVIVDALTRYCMVVAVRSTKTKPVIDALNQLTLYFGLPVKLITDRGTAFTSSSFEDFCKVNDIQHIKVAVRTPRANGLAERINQTILSFLKPTTNNDNRDWDSELRMIQWSLNTKVNTTTKAAPIDLVFDFPMRDLSGNKLLTALHDDAHLEMQNRRQTAIENIEIARVKWKKRFDAKHQTPTKYVEGDLVLLEAPPANTGESRKLQPIYRGPYEVKKVLRYDRYVVEDVDGLQRSRRRFSTIATATKMKPWCALFPELDDDFDQDEHDDHT